MIVVCDASPLIALLAVDRIDLLERLFGSVIIPPAVCEEVFGSTEGRQQLPCPAFVTVAVLAADTPARFLKMNLHAGESEAISLALERNSDLIVLDDKMARETAERLGLRVVGTLGLLMLAKERGLIPAIRSLMIQLMERISFRISPSVLNKALSLLNEPLL